MNRGLHDRAFGLGIERIPAAHHPYRHRNPRPPERPARPNSRPLARPPMRQRHGNKPQIFSRLRLGG